MVVDLARVNPIPLHASSTRGEIVAGLCYILQSNRVGGAYASKPRSWTLNPVCPQYGCQIQRATNSKDDEEEYEQRPCPLHNWKPKLYLIFICYCPPQQISWFARVVKREDLRSSALKCVRHGLGKYLKRLDGKSLPNNWWDIKEMMCLSSYISYLTMCWCVHCITEGKGRKTPSITNTKHLPFFLLQTTPTLTRSWRLKQWEAFLVSRMTSQLDWSSWTRADAFDDIRPSIRCTWEKLAPNSLANRARSAVGVMWFRNLFHLFLDSTELLLQFSNSTPHVFQIHLQNLILPHDCHPSVPLYNLPRRIDRSCCNGTGQSTLCVQDMKTAS